MNALFIVLVPVALAAGVVLEYKFSLYRKAALSRRVYQRIIWNMFFRWSVNMQFPWKGVLLVGALVVLCLGFAGVHLTGPHDLPPYVSMEGINEVPQSRISPYTAERIKVMRQGNKRPHEH
jgi:hypothetical protein